MIDERKLTPFRVMKMHEGCSGCSSWMMQSPMDTQTERDLMAKILDHYIAALEVEMAADAEERKDREIEDLLNQKHTS